MPTLQALALELARLMTDGLSVMAHLRSCLLLRMWLGLVVALLERSMDAASSHHSAVALQTIPEQVVRPLMGRVDVLVHLRRVAGIELGLRLLSAIDIHILLTSFLAALHLFEGHRLLGGLDELWIVVDVGLTVVGQLGLVGASSLCRFLRSPP